MRTWTDLQQAASRARCRLDDARVRTLGGRDELVGLFTCPDVNDGDAWASARLLRELSEGDVDLPIVRDLAWKIRTAGAVGPRALHAFAKRGVRFQREKVETFRSAAYTLRTRKGDCDDSERVVWAVARAAGIGVRYVFFCQGGQPSHVSIQVLDDGTWRWAETTIPARYGEHPFRALRRLGKRRPDVEGVAYLVYPTGEAVPMPPEDDDESLAAPVALDASAPKNLGAIALGPLPPTIGDGFPSTLVRLCAARGLDPFGTAKLLLNESGLNPSAFNPNGFAPGGGAAGINQLAGEPGAVGSWSIFLNRGLSLAQYLGLTAEEQLPFAFAYWDGVLGGRRGVTPRDLYWFNFLPATYVPGAPDSHVIVPPGSPRYAPNAGLDHGQKGFITAGDLQLAIDAMPAAHPHLWPILEQQIRDAGGSSPGTGIVGAVAAVVFGLGLAWWAAS